MHSAPVARHSIAGDACGAINDIVGRQRPPPAAAGVLLSPDDVLAQYACDSEHSYLAACIRQIARA
jgi:hypothetical protein